MRLLLAGALSALFAASAGAQAYKPPRTADGRPDLQGVWSNQWLTPLEKAPGVEALVVSAEESKAVAAKIHKSVSSLGALANDPELNQPDAFDLTVVRGEHRTRLVVEPADGKIPYSDAGKATVQKARMWLNQRSMTGVGEGPEDRLLWERCLAGMGQAPMLINWPINMQRRIVQTKDAVVIHSEAGGETRVIRIGGQPQHDALRSFIGDSVARWEGDTLVIETTRFRDEDYFRQSITDAPILVGKSSKVVEKLSRVSDKEIVYWFTVEDAGLYAKPWFAEYSMMASDDPMYEFACHEGNYGLPNILKGGREAERRRAVAAAATAKPAQ